MSTPVQAELSTKERLIEAAISIIEAEGEVALRVDRVVEIAGFTKPVLYHHFTDREGIIAAAQAERFRRTLDLGMDDALESVSAVSTPQDFLEVMRGLLRQFAAPAGQDRRRFRIEVLGSAVSRPALMKSIVEAGRTHAAKFEMPMRIAADRGWLQTDVPIRDFSQWWTGLMLSRYLFEMDPDGFDVESWDAVTDAVMRSMIRGI